VTLLALRSEFFFGFEWTWNVFDLVIVFFSLFQEVLNIFDIKSVDTSFLRILRFARISKILRMFEAMRNCKEVKIMVDSLMGSFFIFLCCVMMLGLYLSVFAIFFVQGMTSKLEDEKPANPIAAHTKSSIAAHFSTVLESMVTLFMALTGGEDWNKFFQTVQEVGVAYSILFLFFYLFALMSFFNVITGVFCEKAMSLARPSPHELMVRRQVKEVRDARDLITLLRRILKIPRDVAPCLSPDTFDEFLTHPDVITYFEVRGLNPSTAHRFFQVLSDVTQSNEIDFRTFVSACVKLDGPASSIDLHVLSVEAKAVQMSLHNLHTNNMRSFEKIMAAINASQLAPVTSRSPKDKPLPVLAQAQHNSERAMTWSPSNGFIPEVPPRTLGDFDEMPDWRVLSDEAERGGSLGPDVEIQYPGVEEDLALLRRFKDTGEPLSAAEVDLDSLTPSQVGKIQTMPSPYQPSAFDNFFSTGLANGRKQEPTADGLQSELTFTTLQSEWTGGSAPSSFPVTFHAV